ncbi:MAG: stage III sporulation protein AE [Clostridiales bacterium]|nr:stage III sporulation protein AE [Clostridiales bacterium]
MKKIAFVIIICLMTTVKVFAADLDGKLSDYNFADISDIFEENTGISVDFKSLVYQTAAGDSEGLLKHIGRLIVSRLLGEGLDALKGLRILLGTAVLGGLFKNLTAGFADKETAETGFTVYYMLIAGIAMGTYLPVVSLLENYSEGITNIVTGSLPLMLTLITAVGRPAQAVSYGSAVSVGSVLAVDGIRTFVVPLMKLSAVICIVNYISEEGMIEKLFNVLKTIVKYGIRTAAFGFALITGLCRISSSLGENALKKGMENIVGMVPVAGDIIKGSIGTGFVIVNSIKSSAGIVFIILLLIYALLPGVKALLTGFAFKITAGLIEPVCDKRVVELLDSLGDLTLLIFSIMFVICSIFVYSALIFTALTIR